MSSLLSVRREVGEFRKRYKWMALVVIAVFGALLGRMIQLQIVEHDRYAAIARDNITRTITLPATRGVIRDTGGRIVATNRAAFNVYLTPQYLASSDLARIAELMGLDAEARATLARRVEEVPAPRRAHQIRVFTDVTRDQLAALETHQQDLCARAGTSERPIRLPCLYTAAEPVRTYPYEQLGAHAIGYLNELSGEELERLAPAGYRLGDRIGRTGLERAWESYLRGRRGYRRVFVDVRGREVEDALPTDDRPTRRDPVPGRDLTLSLDMELMRIIHRAFAGRPSGAAVVVDVRTGAVRALYSKPSYDLGAFTRGLTHAEYATLRDDPFRPLIDKTIYESWFPGSTFKPFAALAALEHRTLDPNERIECTGHIDLGNRRFHCTQSHGEVNMREAIVQSCNVYFYRLAEQVGQDELAHLAGDFGLGRRTGIGINAEAAGLVPTRGWYETAGRRFMLGYTLNTAIGQGDTRANLVQVAMAYAAIANGGTLYVPQLVERVTTPSGETVEEFEPRVRRRVQVAPEHLRLLIDGLYGAVNDPGGTAYEAAHQVRGTVAIAGKTGTAQVSQRVRPGDPDRGTWTRRPHAWFAGFAPAHDPQVAIVVLVEHGGGGGTNAAPIAVNVLEEYLGGQASTASAPPLPPARSARATRVARR
ncbi:MAG: penicillin-binding protein 2 [Sandaracinaceae bacterium]|nr:penicillin-binding protein 2 [Sandaracinaceae bacterium]